MRGARQRRRRHHQEALGEGDGLERLEFVRRHEAHHRMMLAGRLQILPDGEEIDAGRAQVVHHLQHLVSLLAQAHHDAGLGEHRRVDLLDALQQPERGEIARARPHRQIERRHGFEIVVEHVGPRRDHLLDRAVLAEEIRRQHLDRGGGAARADGADGLREMLRAAVGEIVAIDRGDHDVGEAELLRRLRDMHGLVRIERARQSGLDVAEGAGARAGVAQDHEGGVLLLPALADVGAAGLLAHGVQAVLAHDGVRRRIALGHRRLDADPVGLAQHGGVRPMRLFRVARLACGVVEHDGHDVPYLRRRPPARNGAAVPRRFSASTLAHPVPPSAPCPADFG